MELSESLRKFTSSGIYPFHMPGHKRNPDFNFVSNPLEIDVTELDETDDLHSADGILSRAMKRAQDVFCAEKTFFCVGGSTTGILSAVYALTRENDKVLIARNCHKSVYNAVCLKRLDARFVCPENVKGFSFCASVSPCDVERAFEENPGITLAVITSPTYEGVVSDIAAIADIVHRHNALLLVDEAHGAHFGFDGFFPQSAAKLGADVVVQSLHKTLPCFTQTALVHICTKRVDIQKMQNSLGIFETSSPSYILMSSVDGCIGLLQNSGKELFAAYAKRLHRFYKECETLEKLKVFGVCLMKPKGCFERDPSKIVVSVRETPINGEELYYMLKDRFKLQLEMYSADYVLAVTSICDTDGGFERLISALKEIDRQICKVPEAKGETEKFVLPKQGMSLSKALSRESESVDLKNCEGRICAGFVYAYPPGIPIFAPGEVISGQGMKKISDLKRISVSIQGSAVAADGKINVVKEKKLPQRIDTE